MPKAKSEKIVFYGTGRRKKSIARVRLVEGTGVITINGRNIDEYFGAETLKVIVRQPLTSTDTVTKYDVICKVEPCLQNYKTSDKIRKKIIWRYDASNRFINKAS